MRSWCRLYIYPRYTDLCPQCTGSSGIAPRRGISYSDASFSAPPFEKSAQCSCGCTEQRSSLYCRQSLKLGLSCFYWKTISLFPGISIESRSQTIPKSGKRVWCSEWHLHGGSYWKKNVATALRLQLSDSLDGCKVWITKLEKAMKSLGTVENRLWDKGFSYIQFSSNYDCLCDVQLHILQSLKFKSNLALCGKPEHQTLFSCTCKRVWARD